VIHLPSSERSAVAGRATSSYAIEIRFAGALPTTSARRIMTSL
jgi:hypothetical protein